MKKKKFLITGVTGFLGGEIARQLSRKNEVIGLSKTGGEGFVPFDLSSDEPLGLGPRGGVDTVLHLGALTDIKTCENCPELAYKINVRGTEKLLKFAKKNKVKNFVFASTGGVYGKNVYANTKLAAEKKVLEYSKYFPCIILRFFFPYGPNQERKRLIPRLIDKIYKGEEISLNNQGKPLVNPIYLDDAIRASILSCDLGETVVLDIAGNETASIKEICEVIGGFIRKEPIFLCTGKEVDDLIGNVKETEKKIGFKPKITLKRGLELCVKEYMKKHR